MKQHKSDQLAVTIGKNVRAARDALDWTQEGLAERTGTMSRGTIAKIESFAATNVSLSKLADIAAAFYIPAYMFLLDNVDWKNLADAAVRSRERIDEYMNSGKEIISSNSVAAIEDLSRSQSVHERRTATRETNAVVAEIFGIEAQTDSDETAALEIARTAGVAMAVSMIPSFPIFNGVIATLLSR